MMAAVRTPPPALSTLLLLCLSTARSAPVGDKHHAVTLQPPASAEANSNEVELTELAWVAVELTDLRVSIKTFECYHFSKYIDPLLSVSLEDTVAGSGSASSGGGGAPQRRAQTWRLTPEWRLPSSVKSARFVTYYYRNASLATALVGHNKDFRDPLRKPEILAGSRPVALAKALRLGEQQLTGPCYNVTANVSPLDMASLVPTTTASPAEVVAAARAVESPLYHVSMEGGGPLARAAAPVWMLLLAAVVFLLLLAAFVMLFVVHVRTRKRYAGSTCSGLSPSSFGSKPASAFSHRSQSASGCRSLKLAACPVVGGHSRNGTAAANGSAHALSQANTSGSTIYQYQTAPSANGGGAPCGGGAMQLVSTGGLPATVPQPPAAPGGAVPPCGVLTLKHPTVVRAHSNSDAESHYDVPWDHKYRPLPDWLRTDLANTLAHDGRQCHTVAVRPVPPPGVTILCDSGVEST